MPVGRLLTPTSITSSASLFLSLNGSDLTWIAVRVVYRYRKIDIDSLERSQPAKKKTDLLRGTLDPLILRTLDLGPLHGIAVADRIRQVTHGTFDVQAGSLFPAHRL
jgi:hypothetical protein